MKRIIFCFALMLGAIACDTQPDAVLPGKEKPAVLNIITPTATFETEGGNAEIKIVSTNDWTARLVIDNSSIKDEWCTINTTSGEGDEVTPAVITFTASPNNTYNNRTATVYVSSGNYNKTAKLTQKQLDVVTVVNPQYNVTAKGEILTVELKSNVVSNAVIDSDVDWIKKVDNASSQTRAYAPMLFHFEVSPNTTGAERQTDIHFVYKNIDEKVTVIQAPADEEDNSDSAE